MMKYETPASYGTTTVNVGGVVKNDQILFAGANNTAQHTEIKGDKETEWPEPSAVKYTWNDSKSNQQAVIEGPFGTRIDRVDVMAEVPGFVKQIVAGAAGTKPYIYQVRDIEVYHFWAKLLLTMNSSHQSSQSRSSLQTAKRHEKRVRCLRR